MILSHSNQWNQIVRSVVISIVFLVISTYSNKRGSLVHKPPTLFLNISLIVYTICCDRKWLTFLLMFGSKRVCMDDQTKLYFFSKDFGGKVMWNLFVVTIAVKGRTSKFSLSLCSFFSCSKSIRLLHLYNSWFFGGVIHRQIIHLQRDNSASAAASFCNIWDLRANVCSSH